MIHELMQSRKALTLSHLSAHRGWGQLLSLGTQEQNGCSFLGSRISPSPLSPS